MVGNSSSGITEIPLLNILVINIGDRQSGRPLSSNIIQSDYKEKTILDTINSIINKKNFITRKNIKSFYYKKRTRYEIVKILKKINLNKIKEKDLLIVKNFYKLKKYEKYEKFFLCTKHESIKMVLKIIKNGTRTIVVIDPRKLLGTLTGGIFKDFFLKTIISI